MNQFDNYFKENNWSGPATEIGGLLFLVAQPSHDVSFLQEIKNMIPVYNGNNIKRNIFFILSQNDG